jgi:FkbM family methyltransferase
VRTDADSEAVVGQTRSLDRAVRPLLRRLGAQRLGPRKLQSFLLTNRAAVRQHPRDYQKALSAHQRANLLEALLRRRRVNVVLDVGANRGQFGRELRSLGYRGRIVSYEPVPSNVLELRAAAAPDHDWLVEDFGLGDADSTAEINVSAGRGGLSSLLTSNAYGRARFPYLREEATVPEQVQVRRLDGVYERAVAGIDQPRVFLKLDTQGYDLAALAGAGERLDEFVALQSELSCIPIYEGMPHVTEQIAAYEAAGFTIAGMFPVSWDTDTLAVIELDVLMVRRTPSGQDASG